MFRSRSFDHQFLDDDLGLDVRLRLRTPPAGCRSRRRLHRIGGLGLLAEIDAAREIGVVRLGLAGGAAVADHKRPHLAVAEALQELPAHDVGAVVAKQVEEVVDEAAVGHDRDSSLRPLQEPLHEHPGSCPDLLSRLPNRRLPPRVLVRLHIAEVDGRELLLIRADACSLVARVNAVLLTDPLVRNERRCTCERKVQVGQSGLWQ